MWAHDFFFCATLQAGSRPADFIPMLSGTPLELVDIDSYAYIGVSFEEVRERLETQHARESPRPRWRGWHRVGPPD